jgi:hypothetical protein
VRQPLRRRLGHSEVDDLRDSLAVSHLHQDVRRLDVAVDDPLLVRVLHSCTHLLEQSIVS